MNYLQVAGFLDNSLANGEGLRSVVFVSGCSHKCSGCHNEIMQDFAYGDKVLIDEVLQRIRSNIPVIKGVTFSGGEPFEQAGTLSQLARDIKRFELNIWCYTGFTFEEIINSMSDNKQWQELLYQIDVLVDGRFEESKRNNKLKYKGSSNQRIIDVKKSLEKREVILFIP
ncbi:anaerobic ribonucleoside-triphosphate reductase activating protein [Clostridium pascui]|uniref:anaerobic ribonucleoside-triphosphate reductase activating protein n=1 Tax=Clostridium pascui TaxID=46609 RepID=UPI00195F0C7D|nr:anaerobic ribonucleoside-triphosphate reductase activating protein [Clostridium pascui]MBM7870622.1 anaerobic ribonucleoside-triphosphate reductase activating protein [Clostridium pascui]